MPSLYSEKRKDFKTGDLLAWKTVRIRSFFDFVLFLYQKILKAEYTHVGIVLKEGDRYFIVEATPPVVRIFPISMTDDFYHFALDLNVKSSNVDSLLKHLGKKYSLFDLVTSMFKIGNNTSDYYCSELANTFYNDIGYYDDIDAGLTPDTLVNAVLKRSGVQPVLIKNDRGNLNDV